MTSQPTLLKSNRLSSEDILELSSAYFSLRVALIFLIVTVIVFIIMQLVKLTCQIMKIRSKAEKLYDNAAPALVVHSKRSKRRKRSKHSLPSKRMKIQLSLRNEPETLADCEMAQNEVHTATNAAPYDENQKFSDELPTPDIKDSLALFGSQDSSRLTPISIKKKPTFSALKAQDSLMVVNSQASLQPFHNAEKINEKVGFKDKSMATNVQDSDDKSCFVPAKAQDSLMVVNDMKPLQPSASAEQTNLVDCNDEKKLHHT